MAYVAGVFPFGSALYEVTQAIQCLSIRETEPFFGLCTEQIGSIITVKSDVTVRHAAKTLQRKD
jgi:hypothetical protein